LWKSLPEAALTLVSYTCCDQVDTSDHSPVAATFMVASLPPNIPHERKSCIITMDSISAQGLEHVQAGAMYVPAIDTD